MLFVTSPETKRVSEEFSEEFSAVMLARIVNARVCRLIRVQQPSKDKALRLSLGSVMFQVNTVCLHIFCTKSISQEHPFCSIFGVLGVREVE